MDVILEVKNLSAGYRSPVVSNVDLQAASGELVGILGRNGLGKTTLLRGITGDARRFSGTVRVCGRDCAGLSVRQQARLMAVLPQKNQIPQGITGRDILEMSGYAGGSLWGGVTEKLQGRICLWAERLKIGELLDRDCACLSVGQQQMILLCRLLVQDTPVLLLDEPNAALDYVNTQAIFHMLKSVLREQGKAAVAVLHDPQLALQWCDRLLLMENGTVTETLCPGSMQAEQLTRSLGRLFPGIRVVYDPQAGRQFCYTQPESDIHFL